jgi:hypothetical protein
MRSKDDGWKDREKKKKEKDMVDLTKAYEANKLDLVLIVKIT